VGMRGKEGVGLFCIYWLLELVWGVRLYPRGNRLKDCVGLL
jgi:hypothetical protein